MEERIKELEKKVEALIELSYADMELLDSILEVSESNHKRIELLSDIAVHLKSYCNLNSEQIKVLRKELREGRA